MRLFLFLIAQWFPTVVEIPVNHPVEEYLAMPRAKIYYEDMTEIDTGIITYSNSYTLRKDSINTSVVGSYHVLYTATIHLNTKHKLHKEILFDVVDKVAPVVLEVKPIKIPLKTKLPDPKNYIRCADNYYSNEDLKITTVGYDTINTNYIGIKEFQYEISDLSGNVTNHKGTVEVIDDKAPVIKQKRELNLQLDDVISIYDFFEFKDDYDEVLQIDYKIDTSNIGKYTTQLIVSDQSGNKSTLLISYKVDKKRFELTLKKEHIKLNINDFNKLSEVIKDNVYQSNGNVSFGEPRYEIGKQVIQIYDKDHLGYESKKQLTLELYDDEAPSYELLNHLNLKVFSLDPYIPDYLKVFDNYDKKPTLKYTGKINMSELGQYRILVEIYDQSNNVTKVPLVFEVFDDSAPTIEQTNPIVITNFSAPKYEDYFKITDNYDKKLNLELITLIDYQKIGIYEIELRTKDQSNNQAVFQTTIEIKDTTIPQINLATDEIYINFPDKITDFKKYVTSCEDLYDEVSIDNLVITHNINFEQVGRYEIKYYIEDISKNSSEKKIVVIIRDQTAPNLKVEDYYKIKLEDVPNLVTFATAYDDYDKDISHLITVTSPKIDKAGKYEVLYEITDKSGNYVNKKIIIEVEPSFNYKIIIIGVVSLTFFVILVYTIWRSKKRKNFDNSKNYTYNE
ncbi:ABC-type transport system, lipoprotein [Alteracholeplasma palmae J233]|uniref:ABC-type transport system, lipoprotein n=1 Tax=Alteracholeplasma palmae (strain ATCC 49389 / J233) TaxID=1318466 RepID=U4KLM1_ALTPJ|nr:hypothetical protein [Alteracholeplasma palmae]CCV64768.1 ABC-type transport system, lipoprotein [Alteracholeplasma palmae J233]